MKYREFFDEMGSNWRKRIKVGRKMSPREEDIDRGSVDRISLDRIS
jgi:hypothetical protein